MSQQPLRDPRNVPQRGDALFINGRRWRCCGVRPGDRVEIETAAATAVIPLTDWQVLAAQAEAVTVSLRRD